VVDVQGLILYTLRSLTKGGGYNKCQVTTNNSSSRGHMGKCPAVRLHKGSTL